MIELLRTLEQKWREQAADDYERTEYGLGRQQFQGEAADELSAILRDHSGEARKAEARKAEVAGIGVEKALREARQKLQLYREAHSGEYVGGLEYTQLIRLIDIALTNPTPTEASGSRSTSATVCSCPQFNCPVHTFRQPSDTACTFHHPAPFASAPITGGHESTVMRVGYGTSSDAAMWQFSDEDAARVGRIALQILVGSPDLSLENCIYLGRKLLAGIRDHDVIEQRARELSKEKK